MTTSKQKNTMNCFQAVYGDNTKNRYSIVSDLREKLEAVGIETRGEETKGNMEILVLHKNVRRAVDLIRHDLIRHDECNQQCVVTARYRPVIYYKRKDAVRWMKWYEIYLGYASKSLARSRARLEILDFKTTDPDGYKQLQFRIKVEEANPENDDADTDASLSESQT